VSRSYKHVSIFGNCSHSDKSDKRIANRRLRRLNRELIKSTPVELLDDVCYLSIRDVSSTWDFAKDGKHYWPPVLDVSPWPWSFETPEERRLRRAKALRK
jgi:hypothetical protein